MDITTMMLGSMPQAPVKGELTAKTPAAPGSPGQAGECSSNGLLFAKLLGSSLQAKVPGILPTSDIMAPEIAEIAASGETTNSTVAAVAEQMLLVGKQEKEGVTQSVMQLINGLRMLLSGAGNAAAPGQAEGKAGDDAEQLLAELQTMVAQDGSLTPSLKEGLRGVLNPAVLKKEGQIAVSVTGATDGASGEQKASEMLTALIATLNGTLKQGPQKEDPDMPVEAVSVMVASDVASGEQKASEMLTALMATLNRELQQDSQQVVKKEVAGKPVEAVSAPLVTDAASVEKKSKEILTAVMETLSRELKQVSQNGVVDMPVATDAAFGKQKSGEFLTAEMATLNKELKQYSQQVMQDEVAGKPVEAVSVALDRDAASVEQKSKEILTAVMETLNRELKQVSQNEVVDMPVATDAAFGKQESGEILTAEMATLNKVLKQDENKAVGKPVDETKGSNAASPTVPVVKPGQQAIQEARPVLQKGELQSPDEVTVNSLIAEVEPNQVEKPEMSASQQAPAELKAGASGNERVNPKSSVFHNAAVAATANSTPVMNQQESQKPDNDTKPVKPEPQVAEPVEIVFKEVDPIAEQSPGISQKQEPAVGVRQDVIRSESSQVLPREAAERPAAEAVTREQIVNQVREKIEEHRITADKGQVTIRLNPAELGELKINVRMDDQRLRVEIVAENKTVKDALMENVGSLKEALARQNMDMKQFDVSTGSRQFFNQGFREGRQQEQQFASARQAPWLMGHADDVLAKGQVAWQPKKSALLDMMM